MGAKRLTLSIPPPMDWKRIYSGKVPGDPSVGPQPSRKYVLAGNYWQFKAYCCEQGISPHDRRRVMYLDDPDAVRGFEIPSEDDIVVYGTFWERRDAKQIHIAALQRVRP